MLILYYLSLVYSLRFLYILEVCDRRPVLRTENAIMLHIRPWSLFRILSKKSVPGDVCVMDYIYHTSQGLNG